MARATSGDGPDVGTQERVSEQAAGFEIRQDKGDRAHGHGLDRGQRLLRRRHSSSKLKLSPHIPGRLTSSSNSRNA